MDEKNKLEGAFPYNLSNGATNLHIVLKKSTHCTFSSTGPDVVIFNMTLEDCRILTKGVQEYRELLESLE